MSWNNSSCFSRLSVGVAFSRSTSMSAKSSGLNSVSPNICFQSTSGFCSCGAALFPGGVRTDVREWFEDCSDCLDCLDCLDCFGCFEWSEWSEWSEPTEPSDPNESKLGDLDRADAGLLIIGTLAGFDAAGAVGKDADGLGGGLVGGLGVDEAGGERHVGTGGLGVDEAGGERHVGTGGVERTGILLTGSDGFGSIISSILVVLAFLNLENRNAISCGERTGPRCVDLNILKSVTDTASDSSSIFLNPPLNQHKYVFFFKLFPPPKYIFFYTGYPKKKLHILFFFLI